MHNIPTVHYRAKEVIIHEGEPSNSIYLIVKGKVKVTKQCDKEQITLATQGENTIFGEMTLIDGRRRSATVTAVEDTFCYRCDTISLIKKLNRIDIELLHALKSLALIIRQNNANLIANETKNTNKLDFEPLDTEEEKHFMPLEKILQPGIQKKIKNLESPFIKSLFRVLMQTAKKG